MKYALGFILVLILFGCGEDDMAHIGEEVGSTLTSTNVTDSTQTYSASSTYSDGEIVQSSNKLYVVYVPETDNWVLDAEYMANDAVLYNGNYYKALTDLLLSPCSANIREYDDPFSTYPYFWFRKYGNDGTDDWLGDGTTIVEDKPPTSPPGTITYVFTQTGIDTYDVVINGAPAVSWTILPAYDPTYTKDTYFVYNGKLYQVRIVDRQYYAPDYSSFIGTLWSNVQPHTLVEIGVTNPYKPFDGTNITPAVFASPMTYTITSTGEFNSFTLAKVLADTVSYTFTLPIADANYSKWLNGVPVASGGNGIVATASNVPIDCKRDPDGILSDYPTTVIFYALYNDVIQQMSLGSTVSISLSRSSGNIELGDFTLNNSIDLGYTNVSFTHTLKDWNDYTPDAFGQIPSAVKGIVTALDFSIDLSIDNYDYTVSYYESIAGKDVTIDASDNKGQTIDPKNGKFASTTRRVRVNNPSLGPIIENNELGDYAKLTLKVQEIV